MLSSAANALRLIAKTHKTCIVWRILTAFSDFDYSIWVQIELKADSYLQMYQHLSNQTEFKHNNLEGYCSKVNRNPNAISVLL